MEQLQATFDKLLRETSTTFHRYMYNRINWDARMIGLMGPRGVGKTTLVLQHNWATPYFNRWHSRSRQSG